MCDQDFLLVFGASKLTRGALVPALTNEKKPILIVRHAIKNGCKPVRPVYINNLYSYNEVIVSLESYNKNGFPKQHQTVNGKPCVYVIDFELFKMLLQCLKSVNAFSLCREGIYLYVNVMIEAGKTANVVSFDNAKSIAERANSLSDSITVVKGVAHKVVSSVNDSHDKISVIGDFSPPKFIFPPRMHDIFGISANNYFFTSTDTMEDFSAYVRCKLFFINMPHTLMSVFAYILNGINDETSKKTFAELSNFDIIKSKTLGIMNVVQQENCNDIDKSLVQTWQMLSAKNISYLEKSRDENVGRGLGVDDASLEKFQDHYKYYKRKDRSVDQFYVNFQLLCTTSDGL